MYCSRHHYPVRKYTNFCNDLPFQEIVWIYMDGLLQSWLLNIPFNGSYYAFQSDCAVVCLFLSASFVMIKNACMIYNKVLQETPLFFLCKARVSRLLPRVEASLRKHSRAGWIGPSSGYNSKLSWQKPVFRLVFWWAQFKAETVSI